MQKIGRNSISYYQNLKRIINDGNVDLSTQTYTRSMSTESATQTDSQYIPRCMYLVKELLHPKKQHISRGVSAETFIGSYNCLKVCVKQYF